MLIRDSEGLAELARELKAQGSFALDTEFIREKTYRPRLCLLQIATQDKSVLVDPLSVKDLSPFLALVFDPAVRKVLHAGEQDMEIFFTLGRSIPRNVVDTQVAAALAGYGESVSYAKLVETLQGIKLRKVETFTDWSKRPLTPEQTAYALDDVKFLLPILGTLENELSAMGRDEWLLEELKFYEERTLYEKEPRLLYKRIRGAARLDPRDLAVLRELAAWREEKAMELDWPRSRIVTDETLVELARRAPKTIDSINAVRGIHPQLVKRSGAEIISRSARGLSLPASELPPPLERRTDDPELSLVVDLLEVVLKSKAAEAKIAPTYLGTRKDITELAQRALRGGGIESGEALPILSGWRRRLVGDALVELLLGRSHAKIDARGARVSLVSDPVKETSSGPPGAESSATSR